MFIIDYGIEVHDCVGYGQNVYLVCKKGYELIEGSLLSSLELACQHHSSLDVLDTNVCVPIQCQLPRDWLIYTGT